MAPFSSSVVLQEPDWDRRYRYLWYLFLLFNVVVLIRSGFYYGGFLRGSDGQFYYATARSLVFDRDLDFTNEYGSLTPFPEYLDHEVTALSAVGRPGNKYPIGFGITAIPAIIVGHFLAFFSGRFLGVPYPMDGYSLPYQLSVALGQLLLAFWGAKLLWAFLKQYFPAGISFISVISVWFGTSLFYYSAIFPFMSHASGFFCISALLYLTSKLNPGASIVDLVPIGALFGLAVIIRPTNAILFLPAMTLFFIRTSELSTVERIGDFLVISISAIGVAALQLLAWRSIYGSWFVYSYGSEGFNWFNPQLGNVLFSSNHGLVYFSPIVIVGALGLSLMLLDLELLGLGVAALLSLLFLTHTNAAWHAWWFGHAFGARAFIEAAPLFAFGISNLYSRIVKSPASQIYTCSICIGWTLLLLFLYLSERIPLVGEFKIGKVLQQLF